MSQTTTDPRVRQVDECPLVGMTGVDCGADEWWVSEDGEWLFERLGGWHVVRRSRRNRVFSADSLDEAIRWALGDPR
jgi:hypothetical protein